MKVLLALFFLAFCGGVSAQQLDRSALTSGGSELTNGGFELSVSFGQLAVSSLIQPSQVLTQGFQQPDRNPCFGDLNQDGMINTGDLVILLTDVGCSGAQCVADLNGDLLVNSGDLVYLLTLFGTICP